MKQFAYPHTSLYSDSHKTYYIKHDTSAATSIVKTDNIEKNIFHEN